MSTRRTTLIAALLGAATLQGMIGCSSDGSSQSGTDAGSGGSPSGSGGSASGSGGSGSGSGGASSGSGGAATGSGGGTVGGSGGATTGSGGGTGTGGTAVTDAGSGGTPGMDASTARGYTCTVVIGVSVTYDWFSNGFEMGAGIDNARWEALAPSTPGESFIQTWSNPNASLWSMAKVSPCAMNPNNPDRVIFVGVNWDYTTAAQWLAAYDAAIATIKAKFSNVKSIYLDTLIRGPNNMTCGSGGTANEVVVQPFIDDAIQMAVAKYPGLVKAAPKLYVPNCNVFAPPGPHYTDAGKKVVAKVYSDYYVNDQ